MFMHVLCTFMSVATDVPGSRAKSPMHIDMHTHWRRWVLSRCCIIWHRESPAIVGWLQPTKEIQSRYHTQSSKMMPSLMILSLTTYYISCRAEEKPLITSPTWWRASMRALASSSPTLLHSSLFTTFPHTLIAPKSTTSAQLALLPPSPQPKLLPLFCLMSDSGTLWTNRWMDR